MRSNVSLAAEIIASFMCLICLHKMNDDTVGGIALIILFISTIIMCMC